MFIFRTASCWWVPWRGSATGRRCCRLTHASRAAAGRRTTGRCISARRPRSSSLWTCTAPWSRRYARSTTVPLYLIASHAAARHRTMGKLDVSRHSVHVAYGYEGEWRQWRNRLAGTLALSPTCMMCGCRTPGDEQAYRTRYGVSANKRLQLRTI